MSGIAGLLEQKAGLSPDKAQELEQVILQHITSKVPAEFQGVLMSVLGTGRNNADAQTETAADSGGLGNLFSAASSLFGSKG